MLERAKRASHIESTSVTLRHHAEGMFPTAERTLDLARMFEESLPPRPELENGQGHERKSAELNAASALAQLTGDCLDDFTGSSLVMYSGRRSGHHGTSASCHKLAAQFAAQADAMHLTQVRGRTR